VSRIIWIFDPQPPRGSEGTIFYNYRFSENIGYILAPIQTLDIRTTTIDDDVMGNDFNITFADDNEVASSATAASSAASPFAAPAERFAGKGSVSVRLKKDGRPDWDGLRQKSLERWKELVHDEEFLERFGLQPRPSAVVEVDPALAEQALSLVSQTEALIITYRYKIPFQVALKIASFSDIEKEKMLPPAQRVIGKYLPDFAAKYGDECILAGMMFNALLVRFRAAKQISEQMGKTETESPKEDDSSSLR
jgi:hypothetical protein